ncbi:MAG: hypothetical protein IM561_02060 [Microcystis sp. M60BS1]|uniref:hypothetical protein n=1 Tax=unclassified Microcystis TaxID=2643300 RepID=UPI00257C4C90|nr:MULTISPECIES: hypothetical protein [unclassified Microcystis]MCA2546921.1 hypothetical protein [Microcystis sp. M55BS1]MCA2573676.1 hypothetical protein [Microcystis sp. M42BS1]MCA2594929.1 hypothetical protein [Microcystis sp. M38BS1]MCA2509213.1 hypothetical protein [Microcystis sp. M60BS1]MCA2556605.1 hypothetical protein [Microcystis sp. M43BS1]
MIFKQSKFVLSKKEAFEFMYAVACSGACITSSFVLSRPKNRKCRHVVFVMLKFLRQQDVETFQSFGFEIQEPDKPKAN